MSDLALTIIIVKNIEFFLNDFFSKKKFIIKAIENLLEYSRIFNFLTWSPHCALAILHYEVSEGKRKNSENSNISPCKNIIFNNKKILEKKKPKSFKILL